MIRKRSDKTFRTVNMSEFIYGTEYMTYSQHITSNSELRQPPGAETGTHLTAMGLRIASSFGGALEAVGCVRAY